MDTETKSADARLRRIKIVSRSVGYFIQAIMIFNIAIFWVVSAQAHVGFEISARSCLILLYKILLCCWFADLALLFRFFERGLIFTAHTIRCIKSLGVICLCGWLTMVILHCLTSHSELSPPNLPPGARIVEIHKYNFGFLEYDFGTGIDFGLLLVGVSLVIAAWVMNEGRIIREEQELAV